MQILVKIVPRITATSTSACLGKRVPLFRQQRLGDNPGTTGTNKTLQCLATIRQENLEFKHASVYSVHACSWRFLVVVFIKPRGVG